MKVVKSLKQGFLYRTFEKNNRFYLTTSLLSFFSFAKKPKIHTEIDFWKYFSTINQDNIVLDPGMPKPHAEVLVQGKFFSKNKNPVQAGNVRLNIGPIAKELYIFGNRHWIKSGNMAWGISDPEPMTEMDICYKNSFGGPGFLNNPLGKGFVSPKTPSSKYLALPNIESPKRLIGSIQDTPNPIGFGPLDLTWPQRAKKAGTYDELWLQTRFPGIPDDIDWSYFNAAQEDQQCKTYFQGDESFSFENMHPDKAYLSSKLPGVRPRCFVTHLEGDKENFKEIQTNLDTVWLFPNDEKGLLIYRGTLEIKDPDADDILHLISAFEYMDNALRPVDHYYNALQKRLDKEKGRFHQLSEKDLLPSGEKSGLSDLIENSEDATAQKSEKNFLKDNLIIRGERARDKTIEDMKQLGLDPGKHIDKDPTTVPTLDFDNIDQFIDELDKTLTDAETIKSKEKEDLKKRINALGLDYDSMVNEAKANAGGRPKYSPEETIETLKQVGIYDREVEKQLYENKKKIDQTYRCYGHYFPPAAKPSAQEMITMRESVLAGCKRGESFKGAELTGIDLSNSDLRRIDFSEAFLEGADFSGSDLRGANLTGSILARCNLTTVNLSACQLDNTNFGHALIENTDFSESSMHKSIMVKAKLSNSVFKKTQMTESDFSEALVTGCHFQQSNLNKAKFLATKLSDTQFVKADCSEILFYDTLLDQINFSKSNLTSAMFVNVKGSDINFKQANLTNLRTAMETIFSNSTFQNATLREANLRELNLSKTNFQNADITNADLSKCILHNADFTHANAKQTQFVKADLTGAKLIGINLFEGSLQQACLHETDLHGANLYGVNFMRVQFRNTNLGNANLNKTYLDRWVNK